jgi:hypothetical protein
MNVISVVSCLFFFMIFGIFLRTLILGFFSYFFFVFFSILFVLVLWTARNFVFHSFCFEFIYSQVHNVTAEVDFFYSVLVCIFSKSDEMKLNVPIEVNLFYFLLHFTFGK